MIVRAVMPHSDVSWISRTSALICVSTIPLPTHTSDIYSLSLSHMSAHHMVTHGTVRMCVQLGRGDEWGYTLHMQSSCVVFTVLREISNGTIYLPNIFASYILLSLPARYMRGKSKIISATQVRSSRYMCVRVNLNIAVFNMAEV